MTLMTQQLRNTSDHRALVMCDVNQLLIELALRSSPNEINLNSSEKNSLLWQYKPQHLLEHSSYLSHVSVFHPMVIKETDFITLFFKAQWSVGRAAMVSCRTSCCFVD